MKKLFVFGDSYSDWCNKDSESHQNGETLREEDFWFHKLADYKNLELWNYGRSGYGVGGCFREFMTFCDLISEDDLVIFGLSWWERIEIHAIGYGYNHNAMGYHGSNSTPSNVVEHISNRDKNQSMKMFWQDLFNLSLYNFIESYDEPGLDKQEMKNTKNFVKNVCDFIKSKNLNVKFWTLPEIPNDVTPFIKDNLIDIPMKDSVFNWILDNPKYMVGGGDTNDIDWHFNRKGHDKFFNMVKDKV